MLAMVQVRVWLVPGCTTSPSGSTTNLCCPLARLTAAKRNLQWALTGQDCLYDQTTTFQMKSNIRRASDDTSGRTNYRIRTVLRGQPDLYHVIQCSASQSDMNNKVLWGWDGNQWLGMVMVVTGTKCRLYLTEITTVDKQLRSFPQ